MTRFIQDPDSHGSLKDLQILVNNKKEILDAKISEWKGERVRVESVSPMKADEYAEYTDSDFLAKLGIESQVKHPSVNFWPRNGPQWDALGRSGENLYLVEAKANIPELVSPPTGAGEVSKSQIIDSLSEVKEYLNINDAVDWTGKFYQYTNRIAHLYYLRVMNGFKVHLLFIYFVNDLDVKGPSSIEEWRGAIQIMENYLGISKHHKLKRYIGEFFVEVSALR
ncbi:MAG TPA: hypothetical protein VLX91_03975 [Candidatus Acidoferrales bacterium]|nr:hypothetical protein [Candidatus Acidoferrales bacterium]